MMFQGLYEWIQSLSTLEALVLGITIGIVLHVTYELGKINSSRIL